MLDKTEIANLALGRLAISKQISDLETDNTQNAITLRRLLRQSLDTLLEEHQWNCSTQYLALTKHSDDPSPAYRFAYTYPADALVIRRIAEDGLFSEVREYEEEKAKWKEVYVGSGTRLWTNVINAHAEYTTRLSEDISFPAHFARALGAQLALDAGPQIITANWPKVMNTIMGDARREINKAIAFDMGRQPDESESLCSFLRVRLY